MDRFFDIYKEMVNSSIKLSYKGGISVDLVDSLMFMIEKRLNELEDNINVRKKIYGIVLECIQNLFLHKENDSKDFKFDPASVLLSLDKNNDIYTITTGNFISNENAVKLKSFLENIKNHKTFKELQELYNSVLTNNLYSDKGGGGLGLIDIARKCDNQFTYSFKEINNEYTFYTLEVMIRI